MKFTSVAAATVLAATASAQDVACRINGVQGAVVDLDTGSCSFDLPLSLPVNFDFTAIDDYNVDAYYVTAGQKFWNDIANAGRSIEIPARDLFGSGPLGCFHVHDSETPSSNSTASLKRRFHSQIMNKRDEISDLVAHIKTLSGESVQAFSVEVSDPDVDSSSGSDSTGVATIPTGATTTGFVVTVTDAATTLITITSCSEDKCTEVPSTYVYGPTTTTVNGEVTVYTTWCPISGESTLTASAPGGIKGTVSVDTTITVSATTETISGSVVTVPATTITVTAATATGTAPVGVNVGGTTSVASVVPSYVSTVAGESTASVGTFVNGAGRVGASVLAVVALPLAYLL